MNEDKNFNTPQTEENQSIRTEEPASIPTPFPQTNSIPEQEYPAQNPQFEPSTQSDTDNLSSVAESPRKQRLGVAFYTFLTISIASIICLSYLWFFLEDTSGLLGLFMTIATIPFALVGIIGMIISLIHGNLRPMQANSPVLSSEASKQGIINPSQQRKRFRRLLVFLVLNLLASIIMAATALIFSFTDFNSDPGSAFISILLISNLFVSPVLSAGSLGAIISFVVDLSAKKSWRLYTKKQTSILVIILLISLGLWTIGSVSLSHLGTGDNGEVPETSASQSEELSETSISQSEAKSLLLKCQVNELHDNAGDVTVSLYEIQTVTLSNGKALEGDNFDVKDAQVAELKTSMKSAINEGKCQDKSDSLPQLYVDGFFKEL